jgi:hypothetical protein
MYFFTFIVFAFLALSPFYFLFSKGKNKFWLLLQIIFFAVWNFIFWGVIYGFLPRSFGVPAGSDPEGSVFMLYWLFTPFMVLVLLFEGGYLVFKKTKK